MRPTAAYSHKFRVLCILCCAATTGVASGQDDLAWRTPAASSGAGSAVNPFRSQAQFKTPSSVGAAATQEVQHSASKQPTRSAPQQASVVSKRTAPVQRPAASAAPRQASRVVQASGPATTLRRSDADIAREAIPVAYEEYEELPPGSAPYLEPEYGYEGPMIDYGDPACDVGCGIPMGDCSCGDVGCAGTCGDPCGCGDICSGNCAARGGVPVVLCLPPVQELTIFGGVHGFKGPLDMGRDRGNFGFHEGINLGGRMVWLPFPGVGYQLGYQATHSQLSGDSTNATSDSHTQQFVTAGLFRRQTLGLQYGLVWDLMRDERQMATDFHQVRGLFSVTNPHGHEIGFQFHVSTNEEQVLGETYRAADQYLFFYRVNGKRGGEFRVLAGGGDSQAILGADVMAPLSDRWSLDTGFAYQIPSDTDNGMGGAQESWNLGMNLVWHYGCRARKQFGSAYRPMFRVADNGSMFIHGAE